MIVRNLVATVLMLSIAAAGQGRRGVASASPEQAAAIARLNAASSAQTHRLAEARTGLVAAALAQPRDDLAIRAKIEAIRAADVDIQAKVAPVAETLPEPNRRCHKYDPRQATADRLDPEQVGWLEFAERICTRTRHRHLSGDDSQKARDYPKMPYAAR
jgi:hypothetical protein